MFLKDSLNKFYTLLEKADFEPFSYSGRGMMGAECVGVRWHNHNIASFAFSIHEYLYENSESDAEYKELSYIFMSAFKSVQIDELGRGYVIYFPHVAYEKLT